MILLNKILCFLKNKYLHIILIISILPILFLNINNKHDWGDDFAQYLNQAKHFARIEKPIEPKILDSENYAPLERGIGFSLIIAPVYNIFGNNINAFISLISLSLFLLGMVLYSIFKTQFHKKQELIIPFVLVILVLYNYRTLLLKMEILPIFPFMLLLYLCILMFEKKSIIYSTYLLPITIGFLISVWNIGLAFYLAIILYLLYFLIKKHTNKKLKQLVFTILAPIISYFLIKFIVTGHFSSQNLMWYTQVFISENFYKVFQENSTFYLNTFKLFFEQEVWAWANILIKDFALVFFIIGIFNKWRSKIELMDVFFIVYVFVILLYPYQEAGIRFLLPLIPIILMYIVKGIYSISLKINVLKEKLAIGFLIVVILSNAINFKSTIKDGDSKIIGPNSTEAQEAFIAIRRLVPENDIVCFAKPLALHFYTERKALSTEKYAGINELKNRMETFQTEFLLVCKDKKQKAVYIENLDKDVSECSDFIEIWENRNFVMYQTILNRK